MPNKSSLQGCGGTGNPAAPQAIDSSNEEARGGGRACLLRRWSGIPPTSRRVWRRDVRRVELCVCSRPPRPPAAAIYPPETASPRSSRPEADDAPPRLNFRLRIVVRRSRAAHAARRWQICQQGGPERMANDMAERQRIMRTEEYRSRWGARASNPLEGAQAFSVGSTPASSGHVSFPPPLSRRCLNRATMTSFPHPAHRTGHGDLPHPALGQSFTPLSTMGRAQVGSDVRARSTRSFCR